MGSELGLTADSKSELQMGALGIFWILFTTFWTIALVGGMAFLWVRRDMPLLRIRGLGLSFAAIFFLHLYWIAVELAYIYAALLPQEVQYWIMSTWLPFGIALFQAANSRFLYVADGQRKFLKKADTPPEPVESVSRKNILGRWRQKDHTQRTLFLIGIGMGFQLFVTFFMFLISRKFHASWGIPGTEVTGTPMQQKAEQGTGWEWWPSIFWQMFWAWVIAPCILWRARNLRDTQGWRFQTIACCISGLPAAPMWLVALYAPGMDAVNAVFIPPQWIAVSIMLLEIFTVFVPIVEVLKHQSLTQETLDSIARWETRKAAFGGGGNKSVNTDTTTASSWLGRMGRASSVHTSSGGSILTMDALEHTLTKNPEPLQHFSALKDFSGENIAFLTRVKEWRATYFPTTKESSEKDDDSTKELPRECYESALRIYVDFISATHAEFQINLSSTDFKTLQAIFENAARIICGDERKSPDPATPFDDTPRRTDSESTLNIVRYWGDIPEEFSGAVFDNAEISIKYLVLTNTWPKFIKERRSFDGASLEAGR